MDRLKSFEYSGQDFRLPLVEVLTLQDTRTNKENALEYIGSMAWFGRFTGVSTMVWAYARINEYQKAVASIPALASVDDRLRIYDKILLHENIKRGNASGVWNSYFTNVLYNENRIFFQNDLLPD
jgi:hypothetical protein